MGSAVGQVPEYTEMITGWVKEKARTPVLVKLTPNITDIRQIARAAKRAGADGLSAINTINSITGIDLDTLEPQAERGRAVFARRLLRTRGETDRVEHGASASERRGFAAAHLGHRRHRHLARRGRVYSAGLRHGAGVYRRDALRLSHRRGHDRRPAKTGCAKKASRASRIFAG